MQHSVAACNLHAALYTAMSHHRCTDAAMRARSHVRLPLHVVCRSHAAHCRAWLCFDTVRVLLLLSLCAAGKALVLRFDISLGIRQCCADRQPRFVAAHVRLTHSLTRSRTEWALRCCRCSRRYLLLAALLHAACCVPAAGIGAKWDRQ